MSTHQTKPDHLRTLMRTRYRSDAGFTLVELLVVVIIIGILAAIAIPLYLNQQKKGHDSTLRSDLRSVAAAVDNFNASGQTNADLRAITGATNTVEVRGKNRGTSTTPQWNSFETLGRVVIADDSTLSVLVYPSASGRWLAHSDGDYCITGGNAKSSYSYPGGGATNYDQFLFFDRQAGGVRSMDELVQHRTDGGGVSCKGFVDTYMAARGIPIP